LATTKVATTAAILRFEEVLRWLQNNRLEVDPSKLELMTFMKTHANMNLVGGNIHGAHYTDPASSA